MKTYRITSLIGGFGNINPPALVYAIFPAFDGWPVTLSEQECIVTVPDGIEPLNLSQLIKIELL